ncbi:MAG TPA: serine hydrolase domain-containing protein [Vicinamibacterales bacterium]|nr:serine hydrolase domain-containing protein [Vicinamibacterales bacterium]
MTKKQTWLAVILLIPGLVILVVVGLFLAAASTPPLHKNAQEVPSSTLSPPSAEWRENVERASQIARAGLIEQNLPGLSVAVGVGDQIVWAEGFGWADLEKRVPVAPDTRFWIGTASTVLTSAGVGLLLEKEQVKLDAKIQTYVPEFTEKKWPVTLQQLMAQVAGVRRDQGDEEPIGVRCDQTSEGLARFAEKPLVFEPGTRFQDTTYGWVLISAAVDSVAGEPFFTFMQKQVFEPLGMKDTNANGEPAPDRAVHYFPKFAANTRYGPQEPAEEDFSCFSGAGAFLSTPSDMVRFGLAIAHGKLLKPETVQLLQTPQRLTSGQETGYGLGWDLETVDLAGEQTVMAGHDGDLRGGMVASFMTFPRQGIVVAVMSNTSFADTYSLGVKIAQAFKQKDSGGK